METPFKDILLYFLVGVVLVGGVLGGLDALSSPSAAQGTTGHAVNFASLFHNPVANLERLNLLLIGCDARVTPDGRRDPGRADTLIVVCLSPKNKRMAMVSLPRDCLVTIPRVPKGVPAFPQKINHAYSFGGTPLVRSTVEQVLGFRMDYYLKTDLDTFVEAVDMLGGVDIEVPDIEGRGRGMNYDDNWGNLHIRLKPGLQHLDGKQAMGFVRYRKSSRRNAEGHVIGLTDMERASNQQLFIKAMLEQKVKLGNLPSLLRAGGHILARLETDMEWPTAVGLMKVFRHVDSTQIMQLVVPTRDRTIHGTYYCEAPQEEILQQQSEIAAFLSGAIQLPAAQAEEGAASREVVAAPVKPVAPERPLGVKVLNGSGVAGAAKRAAQLLRGSTYRIDSIGNAKSYDHATTSIQYGSGCEEAATRAAKLLGVPGAELKLRSEKTGAPDLVIVVGSDFAPRSSGAGRPR